MVRSETNLGANVKEKINLVSMEITQIRVFLNIFVFDFLHVAEFRRRRILLQ